MEGAALTHVRIAFKSSIKGLCPGSCVARGVSDILCLDTTGEAALQLGAVADQD
jgi:hypothetical protein